MADRKTPDLLMVGEVARMLRVNPKTVTLWANNGRIPPSAVLKTVGGHRRIRRSFVDAHPRGQPGPPARDPLRKNPAPSPPGPPPPSGAPAAPPCRLPTGGGAPPP